MVDITATSTDAGDTESERGRLSTGQLASYGAPAAPLALSGLPLAVYLPAVYADADGFGLSLHAHF